MTESNPSLENFSSHTVRITSVKPLTLKTKNDCALHDIGNIIQKLTPHIFNEEFKSNTQELRKKYEAYRELSAHDEIINNPENHKKLLSLFLEKCGKINKNLENIFSQIKLGDDEDSIKTKKIISKNINLLNEQIKEIPDFIDIDNYKVNKEEVNLNKFMSDDIKSIRDGIPDRINHIRIIRPENNISYLFDKKLTKKVLENFIYNAVKYSPEGTNIFISSYEDEKEVKISVKDFGIGLSPDELNSFKEFNPGKTIRFAPDKASGSGLGLYNAFSYAIQQGASVEISSNGKNKGTGSTFSLVFKK